MAKLMVLKWQSRHSSSNREFNNDFGPVVHTVVESNTPMRLDVGFEIPMMVWWDGGGLFDAKFDKRISTIISRSFRCGSFGKMVWRAPYPDGRIDQFEVRLAGFEDLQEAADYDLGSMDSLPREDAFEGYGECDPTAP